MPDWYPENQGNFNVAIVRYEPVKAVPILDALWNN
jgi:hypothetical protein